MSEPIETPGATIKRYRVAADLRQGTFAGALGVSRFTLNQIERERRTVTPEMAIKLERVTGRPALEWLCAQAAASLAELRRRNP